MRKPPLGNLLIRKAIAYTIPYRDIIEKAHPNYSVQAPISGINDYFPQLAQYVDQVLSSKSTEEHLTAELRLIWPRLHNSSTKQGSEMSTEITGENYPMERHSL